MMDLKPWIKKNAAKIEAATRAKNQCRWKKANQTNRVMRRILLDIPPTKTHIEQIKWLAEVRIEDKSIKHVDWCHQWQVMPRKEHLRAYIEFTRSIRLNTIKRRYRGLNATFIKAGRGHKANKLWVHEYSAEAEGASGTPARHVKNDNLNGK